MKGYSKGFTLIELMIAIAIVGILAAIITPAFVEQGEAGSKQQPTPIVDKCGEWCQQENQT